MKDRTNVVKNKTEKLIFCSNIASKSHIRGHTELKSRDICFCAFVIFPDFGAEQSSIKYQRRCHSTGNGRIDKCTF